MYAELLGEHDGSEPELAYEWASLEKFVAAADTERDRLLGGLDEARQDLAAAESRRAAGRDLQARLGAMVLATQQTVADEREDCERSIAKILEEAAVAVGRTLAEARSRSSVLRAYVDRVAGRGPAVPPRSSEVGRISDRPETDPGSRGQGRFVPRAMAS